MEAAVDRPRRAPRPAAGEPLLARRRADARDAAFHHLRGHDLRRVLHGLLLHPRRHPQPVAGARHEAPGGGRGHQHRDPAVLVADDPLGADVDQERQPLRPQGRDARRPSCSASRSCSSRSTSTSTSASRPRLGPGDGLLLAHRPARRARVHRPVPAADGHDPLVPRPLLAGGPPRAWRCRGSTGTSSTSCGSSCTRRST